jgi:hypothetical protein
MKFLEANEQATILECMHKKQDIIHGIAQKIHYNGKDATFFHCHAFNCFKKNNFLNSMV